MTRIQSLRVWWTRVPFETKVDVLRGVLAMAIGLSIFIPMYFVMSWATVALVWMTYQIAPQIYTAMQVFGLVMILLFVLIGIDKLMLGLGWKFAFIIIPKRGRSWRQPIPSEEELLPENQL